MSHKAEFLNATSNESARLVTCPACIEYGERDAQFRCHSDFTSEHMSGSTAIQLDRHEARRSQDVPTISVLVGPHELGHRLWRSWNSGKHRQVVTGSDLAALADNWLRQQADVTERARDWVRRCQGAALPDLSRMTTYDLDLLWHDLPSPAVDPAASVAHRILIAQARSVPFDPVEMMRGSGAAVALAGLWNLLSDRPAFLICHPSDGLLSAIRGFEQVSRLVPPLPLAVCVSEPEFEDCVRLPSRAATLAREGEIRLPRVSPDDLVQRLKEAGVMEPLPDATIRRLTDSGLAEAYVAAAVEARLPAPPDGHRSACERFLFEQLESMIETAGLFTPNHALEFLHGNRSAEADLACTELKLAIEVDGAYYHLNADQYRRDRRKDHAYQRHGYWVLRFLAEDVVADLESILNTILKAVASRRSAG